LALESLVVFEEKAELPGVVQCPFFYMH